MTSEYKLCSGCDAADSVEVNVHGSALMIDERLQPLQEALLSPMPAYKLYKRTDDPELGPVVRLSHPAALAAGLGALGECGDPQCSLERLARPERRRAFRDLVAERAAKVLPGHARYVSIGAGLALMDFELLLSLQARGVRLSSVALHDQRYDGMSAAHDAALQAMERSLDPIQIRAFRTLNSLTVACADDATLFVQCDADEVGEAHALAAAATCLREGGLAFRLTAAGSTKCWRRVRMPAAPALPAVDGDSSRHAFGLELLSSELNPWLEYPLD